jgi:hypothetical protein
MIVMPNSLLTLGAFSFEGLEAPEHIQLKTKQRLAVHHLGSGASTVDYLGDDCEIVSFRGIFSGLNTADRIRSIDYLRVLGAPQVLSWNSRMLSVIIDLFELDYSSDRWIPYRISCYVVRSINAGFDDPTDVLFMSPATQVSDMLDLLANTPINPSPGQTEALLTLATLNFDTPPSGAVDQAQDLANSIDGQLALLDDALQNVNPIDQGLPPGDASHMFALVANYGRQTALLLGLNRAISILTCAEDVNQQ